MCPAPSPRNDALVCCYRSELQDDALRSRSVSEVVLHGRLHIPEPPGRLLADWQWECAQQLGLECGDVEPLPLARSRRRWPALAQCVQAMADWTRSVGLGEVLGQSELALMASRGARYHHDALQYGARVFCNLFLSEDQGLDLHFPAIGVRIPLLRGTAVVFDTGQPHAVVARGASGFVAAHFADASRTQVFLSWELPVEEVRVAHVLTIAFDTEPATTLAGEEGLRRNGAAASLCPHSGRWLAPAL